MIIYGPVPSRRLGQSLGINNIPPKTCSYSCVYCQIGRTDHMRIERSSFYPPVDILREVREKIEKARAAHESIDYLSFVPDGEPTLDRSLGETIGLVKPFGVPVAVITNGSLLWMEDVREDLIKADWVSLKVDALDPGIWRRIDRPHGKLDLNLITKGALDFAGRYQGTLVTETMLVEGINDSEACLESIGKHVAAIHPVKAYIMTPTRPPAEHGVRKPSAAALQKAVDILHEQSGVPIECITGDEGDHFFFTSDIEQDLLSIAAVHPVRKETLLRILKNREIDSSVLDNLLNSYRMQESIYDGEKFYATAQMKNPHNRQSQRED